MQENNEVFAMAVDPNNPMPLEEMELKHHYLKMTASVWRGEKIAAGAITSMVRAECLYYLGTQHKNAKYYEPFFQVMQDYNSETGQRIYDERLRELWKFDSMMRNAAPNSVIHFNYNYRHSISGDQFPPRPTRKHFNLGTV